MHDLHSTDAGLFDSGLEARARRDFGRALAFFRRIVEVRPRDAEAWRHVGDCLRELQRHNDALQAYDTALALQPNDAAVHFGRGATFAAQQKWHEATQEFETALHLAPNDARTALALGMAGENGSSPHEKSADFLQLAFRLNPDWNDPQFYLGFYYYSESDWHNALRIYQQAAKAAPQWAEGRYIVGVLANLQGDFETAVKALNGVTRLRPDWTAAWLALGQTHTDAEEWTAAAKAYRQALILEPHSAEASLGLGTACQMQENWAEALAAYEAVQNAEALPEALFHCGEIYNEMGLPQKAREAFRESLEKRPGNAEAHYGIGIASFRFGDNDGAKEQVDILLQLDQDLAQELYSRCFITQDA